MNAVDKNAVAFGVANALAEDVRRLADLERKPQMFGRAARMDELRERIQGHWDWIYDWMVNDGSA